MTYPLTSATALVVYRYQDPVTFGPSTNIAGLYFEPRDSGQAWMTARGIGHRLTDDRAAAIIGTWVIAQAEWEPGVRPMAKIDPGSLPQDMQQMLRQSLPWPPPADDRSRSRTQIVVPVTRAQVLLVQMRTFAHVPVKQARG